MVDCDKLKSSFSDYLDGELPIDQRKELDNHFADCADCHETIRQMRIIKQSMMQIPHISASPGFEQKLHEQIFRSDQKESFIPQLLQNWKLPAMGSAIVLATVGLFLVFNDSTEPPSNGADPGSQKFLQAAPQIQGSNDAEIPSNESTFSTERSTAIKDSMVADSLRIKPEGFHQVGDNK
jgi:hypothetical protein